jgi:hypothetical protein
MPLAFGAPLVLAALAVLPLIYYLLRITPPRARRIPFPPLRLILDLDPRDETPARTPLWLLLLRLAIAALVVLAMAAPVLNPLPAESASEAPLLVIVDDGWPAAADWDKRLTVAEERLMAAGRSGRPVALLALSARGRPINVADSTHAVSDLRALKPQPFISARREALPAIETFIAAHAGTEILYLADGLENGDGAEFATRLAALAKGRIFVTGHVQQALGTPRSAGGAIEIRVLRAEMSGPSTGRVRALDAKGRSVAEAVFDFGAERETTAKFDLPIEIRNDMARLEIIGEHSAGAVALLDERAKRRRVGIVSGETGDVAQPLVAPDYYVAKALDPYADVQTARPGTTDPVSALLSANLSVLVLTDVGLVAGAAHDHLASFVENGGVLVRFAGARLATASDDLVPVRLRRGGRVLGGALSWETPKKLAPFDQASPFHDLRPADEVTVSRQVLAEPEPGLPGKTWAQLADGTPLVTAARRGKGLIVLFHVTADTGWSNLPLSGLFVDMLRKIIALSGESVVEGQEAGAQLLPPVRVLDGFGALIVPPANVRPLTSAADPELGPDQPPGLYGTAEAPRALNTVPPGMKLVAARFDRLPWPVVTPRDASPTDLRPALLTLAAIGFLADTLATAGLTGAFGFVRRNWRRASAAILIASGIALFNPPMPHAAESPRVPPRDIEAALTTRLAYVVTGDARADQVSRLGLQSLSRALAARTALTPGEPVGVDPARDELTFYPLLYWPVAWNRPLPSPEAIARIGAFMRDGGTIVFDTRDAESSHGEETPAQNWLRRLLATVDVPALEPVPRDHVVTKTFYLIDGFIGRTTTGQTFIEALPPPQDNGPQPARAGDSVSPIVITSNDLAAGWAADADGESLFPLEPGGARQRELAIRGGVNLVMYTLTGNYKSDQVHVRDLLERLGH